jgi:sterol desaturase/sphingolipid hydroxylase (fatty acid hydroxylase superfamily)
MVVIVLLLVCLAGAFTWSLTEYLLHRGFGHRKSRLRFSREHMAHHKDAMVFTSFQNKTQVALLSVAIMAPAAIWVMGWAHGSAYTLGFVLAYLGYEIFHRRLHTHSPTGPYGRWARKHHYYHHFSRPALNHGVTSPIWDLVFRTYAPAGQVRVPRKKTMVWLCDEGGAVKPEFQPDYVLVGRSK